MSFRLLWEQKKTNLGLEVVNSKLPGILKFFIGLGSAVTFSTLWQMIQGWACFLYITNGYKVAPGLIEDCVREVRCGAALI